MKSLQHLNRIVITIFNYLIDALRQVGFNRSSAASIHRSRQRLMKAKYQPQARPFTVWQTVKSGLLNSRFILLVGLVSFTVIACGDETQVVSQSTAPAAKSNTALTIWWEKGFNLEEDEALQKVVTDWEKRSGHKAVLAFQATDDFSQRIQRALQSGNPPDIVMSHNAERGLYPHLAWQGKLVDVTDVVTPVKDIYPAPILEAVYFQNNAINQRHYYAVPFSQSTSFISYWRDLVKQAGYQEQDIPTDWDGFWTFWEKVQDKLRQQPRSGVNPNIYGLGFSFSDKAGDTYQFFEQVLEAFDVQLLTPKGDLRIQDPQVRQGVLDSLKWYTQFYQQGYVPPETVKWLNPDNNTNLLNRTIVMTPNTSLTIPAAVRQDKEVYQDKLGTLSFPKKRNGQPMRHILTIKQAVIFTDSKNQAIAKEFLSYFIQPNVIGGYLKAAGIRNMPIAQPVWEDPYWNTAGDAHIAVGAKVLRSGDTRPFPSVYHPAYSLVTQENVWGKAIHRIVVDKITPEQASEEALARIQTIFEQWQ